MVLGQQQKEHKLRIPDEVKLISALGTVALGGILLVASAVTIPTGYVGIPVLFGKVQPGYLEAGLHFRNPFSRVMKLDLRTQKADEEGTIPSKEMLSMTLKTSINYHIDKAKAGDLYNTLGMDYFNRLIEPHIRSAIREVTSGYNADQFFSGDRNEIQIKIAQALTKTLTPRGIVIESVMLKEISPPETVRRAIEWKQAQQQEAQAMQFKLQRERLEAERKTIEAKGIQDFQEIVKKGIDANLLAWKGIEATEVIARSPNSKIIIIGNKDGMPLITPLQ
jgi:regulator of protease activity HflC (stomatin/prohibitin superfamily)